MYVASKLKEQVNNPVTQADIRDASLAACAALPEGMMRDACTDFVEQYGEQWKDSSTAAAATVAAAAAAAAYDVRLFRRTVPFLSMPLDMCAHVVCTAVDRSVGVKAENCLLSTSCSSHAALKWRQA